MTIVHSLVQHFRSDYAWLTAWGWVLGLLYEAAAAMLSVTYVKLLLSNSGVVPPIEEETLTQSCGLCLQAQPPRAVHCIFCQQCIFKRDHHCFWVNKCVGALNRKYFVLLLFYTAVASGLGLCILAAGLVKTFLLDELVNSTLVNLALVLKILFFLYAYTELVFQCGLIKHNQTTEEHYLNRYGARQTFSQLWVEVFGDSPWDWWRPTQIVRPLNYLEPSLSKAEWLRVLPPTDKERLLLPKHIMRIAWWCVILAVFVSSSPLIEDRYSRLNLHE